MQQPSRRSPWRWLRVGIGIKRWMLLLLVSITLSALGLAIGLRELYFANVRFPAFTYYVTLQFWPRTARMVILCMLGIIGTTIAFTRLNRLLLGALLPPNAPRTDLVGNLWARRRGRRGPRVVALGGGHGLSTLLSGLKLYTDNITAIVSVADDGGSSGRIRQEFGILPPGDIRRCLAALAEAEPLVTELFEYRFATGEGLEGHTFGNLLITALADITGSFDEAVRAASRVLAVRGQIVPATLTDVTLWAELEATDGDSVHISGESRIAKGGAPIKRVYLQPGDAPASRAAVQAIRSADLVVVGPGSLYTSLLSTLLIGEIIQSIRSSEALRVYVCNVATEPGETDNFGVQAHIDALIEHVGPGAFDVALANSNASSRLQFAPEWRGRTKVVPLDTTKREATLPIVTADVINLDNPLRHDPVKLARELILLLEQNRSPS